MYPGNLAFLPAHWEGVRAGQDRCRVSGGTVGRWEGGGEQTHIGQETEIIFQVGSVCVFCVTKLFKLFTLGFCNVLWDVWHFDVIMMDHVGRWRQAGGGQW